MIDFFPSPRTMPFTGPEDRALLGSNPSAAAGDGNQRRSTPRSGWLLHPRASRLVLVPKAINPIPLPYTRPGLKPGPKPRPVCHMSISIGR